MYKRFWVLAARRRMMALVVALGVTATTFAVTSTAPAYADLPPLSCTLIPYGPMVQTLSTGNTILSTSSVVCDFAVKDILLLETLYLNSTEAARDDKFNQGMAVLVATADSHLCIGGQFTSRSQATVDWPAGYTDKDTGLPWSYRETTYTTGIACSNSGSGGSGGSGGPPGGCLVACPGIDGGAAQDLTVPNLSFTGVPVRR